MLAEITVEEDLSALRATPLAKDVKLRIIALNKGTSTIYSWADYTATDNGAFSTTAGNLHVVENTQYDFVCFSYNSTTADLPAALNEGGALGDIPVTNANDFLYEKKSASLSAISNNLSFELKHQLARVNLTFAVNYSNWKITNVNSSPTIGSVTSPSAFDHETNVLSGGTAGSQVFIGLPATPNETQASGALRLVPAGASTLTLTIPKGAVTLSGTSLTVASHPTVARTATLTTALEKGASYTLTVKLKALAKSTKFAGSNIYWDSSKSQLTFDPHGTTTPQYYQGVYFKWGSLIGISPVGAYDASNTVLYKPTNTSDPVGTSRTWVETNGADNAWSGSGWTDIPYQNDDKINTTDRSAHSLLANPDFAAYKGDICNYIDENYLMPTGAEFSALLSDHGSYSSSKGGYISSDITSSDAAGKQVFAQYATINSFIFPASGYRDGSDESSIAVGNSGAYWSGSASGDSYAIFLYFNSSYATASSSSTKYHGLPVRCVLIEYEN
jgi:uncharacterized protein (TIGR02145 family)